MKFIKSYIIYTILFVFIKISQIILFNYFQNYLRRTQYIITQIPIKNKPRYTVFNCCLMSFFTKSLYINQTINSKIKTTGINNLNISLILIEGKKNMKLNNYQVMNRFIIF